MSFEHMCNDIVCLQKINGEKHENINALVEDKMIFLSDTSVLIDEGDKFIREISNGKVEIYEVINPIYYGEFGSLEPHYEVEVIKVLKSNKESKFKDSGHKIHITGNNSPVTINSNDNMINVNLRELNDENVFEELRKCISKEASIENKEELLSSIDDLEKTKGTTGYVKAIKSFVQIAKDGMTIFGPFVPYLVDHLK